MGLAAHANQYIDEHKPWALAKQAAQSADAGDLEVEVQRICTQGLNLFRVLMIYLQPVLPAMAAEVQRFFRESSWSWDDVSTPLLGTAIEQYRALATRLDAKAVARLIEPEAGTPPAPGAVEASSTTAASTAAAANTGARNTQPPTAGAATAGSANAGAANAGSANTRSSNARSPSAHSDNARSSEAGSADSQNARSSDARSAHPDNAPSSGARSPRAHSDNAPSSGARSPSAHSDNAPSSDAHSPSAHSDNTRSRKADSVSAHSDNTRSAGAGSAGASRQTVSPPGASDTAALAAAAAVEGNLITIDEFLRVDLRVARVLSADLIAGADKLLKLRLDVGELGEREIFAGIRSAYDPALLAGRLIVVVANLEPRKMRFGVSEGMMLAAGPGGKDIFILSPDSGAAPGMRVK
jgi:methionine--tRNA ligase beta chain